MNIVVFGSRGMLGRYVSTYFQRKGYEVTNITRNEFDASDFDQYDKLKDILTGKDAVINCMGTIKPVANKQDKKITFMVNSIFPNYLSRVADVLNIKFFHITTDCVFSGKSGLYSEGSAPDMLDDYGFSKSIGDYCCEYGVVIRTSIIGEELENKRSLIEWVKSQKGKTVNGYTNHWWNGVTCLQLAKEIDALLEEPYPNNGLIHICSDIVTKYELIKLISEAFDLGVTVVPVEAPDYCNRTLDSVSKKAIQLDTPILETQIKELVGFYDSSSDL